MYKRIIFCLLTIAAVAFFYSGCQDTPISPPGSTQSPTMTAGTGCDVPNVFCGSPGTIQIQNPCPGNVTTIDLWAGNPPSSVLVGKVEMFFVSGSTWQVKYSFTDPDFTATSIHFAIACTLDGIPQNNKHNPIPGQFPYNFNGPFGSTFTFNVTLPAGCSCFYVAAHAGGDLGGVNCFNTSIPAGCVTVTNMQHAAASGCYWSWTLSNAGTFNGTWCGWCMDLGTDIQVSGFTCAHMYSSLAPFPDYLKPFIEGWQDMDMVNYLLNHFAVGQSIQRMNYLCQPVDGFGTINPFDYQKAIWCILDLGPGSTYAELSDSLVVNAILCDVRANGHGFVPNCLNGDKIAFILDPGLNPDGHQAQPVLAAAPCCNIQGVTAWGDGRYGANFAGNNWATYFKWCPTCP